MKKLHLFCDVRIHEQIKKMGAIKDEIDSFQSFCKVSLEKQNELKLHQAETNALEDENMFSLRGDEFLKSSIQLQSQLIGKVLLEVGMR